MNSFLDHYCERVTAVTWDEPFNTFSNLAFLVAAFFIYQKASSTLPRAEKPFADIWILVILVFAIGIGSATWHILAERWSLWADRLPILVFISLYLLSCLVRILNFPMAKAFAVFFAYHLFNAVVLAAFPAATLNGSLFYIPTAVFLFGITLLLWLEMHPVKHFFTTGSILFLIAIVFRTIDLSLCSLFPVGTHFIWHLLVAITIYVLMSAIINSTLIRPPDTQ